jgi:GT2 family glycosyltransferase
LPPIVAAVVPSWNGRALLESCLPRLLGQDYGFARVLVVDDGSRDGSRELLASVPGVEAHFLARSRGFAVAANTGIREALAERAVEAVALVNNDVELEGGWLAAAAEALASSRNVGSCATCLLQAHRPWLVDSAGIDWSSEGVAATHLCDSPAPPPELSPYEVWGASAAAALYRRELFESVGLFEESFFAYQEDVDLAQRARRHGWGCLLAPAARGRHRGQASNRPFPLGGTWADFLNARNRIAVLVRSLSGADWRRHCSAILAAQLRLLAVSFGERRGGAVAAGLAHGLLRLPRNLAGRRRVSATMAASGRADARPPPWSERRDSDP